jgi:peptide-methionine (S)-S-oxide reductase
MRVTEVDEPTVYGEYVAKARLIWFVAENPNRNNVLPTNIAEVTQTLIGLGREFPNDDLIDQLNETLALVTSSMVARQFHQQRPLIQVLITGGADLNSGIQSAVAHRELDACLGMLENGSALTLSLAAGLGMTKEVIRMAKDVNLDTLQEALTTASINLQAECVKEIMRYDIDVNRFNPKGAHPHSTPLHQAVYGGSEETVRVLLSHRADPRIKDKVFASSSIGWANHEGHHELAQLMSK